MSICIVRFCRGGWCRAEHLDRIIQFCIDCKDAGLEVPMLAIADMSPTDVARNYALELVQAKGFEVAFLLDADTVPDEGFLVAALAAMQSNSAIAAYGAPYCGEGPDYAVHVIGLDGKEIAGSVAKELTGQHIVQAVGTGCVAIRTSCLSLVAKPWFEYKYANAEHTMAGTEDYPFFEKLTAAGGQVVCDFDCWATHYKDEAIGKPR